MDGFGPSLPNLPQLPKIPLMPQVQEAPISSNKPKLKTKQPSGGISWMPGATTVGVVFHGGVILAAEKRVTYGGFIMSRGGKKVFKVTDRIGVACAGLIGDMQILAREMEAQANLYSMDVGRPISVRSASKLMANVLFNRRYAPLITQTIVGGLDEEGSITLCSRRIRLTYSRQVCSSRFRHRNRHRRHRRRLQRQHDTKRSKRPRNTRSQSSHQPRRNERRRHRLSSS